MYVTIAELEKDLDKYLRLSNTKDVLITENGGRLIAKITNANAERRAIAESLCGIIPADITLEEAREERLSKL